MYSRLDFRMYFFATEKFSTSVKGYLTFSYYNCYILKYLFILGLVLIRLNTTIFFLVKFSFKSTAFDSL